MDRRRFLLTWVASICVASAKSLSLLADAVTRSVWPCLILLAALAPAFAAESTTTPGSAASWWLRSIGAVLGLLLITYGLFTVPGSHKKYENYLVRWWIWIEERRETGLKQQTAFLQVVVTVMGNGFDRVFGSKLLSWEAVSASVNLAMCSLAAVTLVWSGLPSVGTYPAASLPKLGASIGIPARLSPLLDFVLSTGLVAACGGAGLSRACFPRLVRYQLAVALVGIGIVLAIALEKLFLPHSSQALSTGQALGPLIVFCSVLFLALLASFVTDVAFVALTRMILKAARTLTALRICGLVGINVVVAVAASLAPMYLGSVLATRFDHPGVIPWVSGFMSMVAVTIGLLNGFDTLIALCVVLLTIVMLVHRLVWPVVANLIQVLADEHVLLKRWPLFFTGVGVLGAAWPAFDVFVKLLGH